MIAGPEEYDVLNDLEVGNYVQRHYIEKEGLRIDYLSEDEEEKVEVEDTEEGISQLNLQEDPPRPYDAPASSSGTFDDLVTITFPCPAASPGITLEGLTGLQTPESRVDPANRSSASTIAITSQASEAPVITGSAQPSTSHGGATS